MQAKTTSKHPGPKVGKEVVFVLGAGVDKVLGLPLVNDLFRDLSAFSRESGKAVHGAIRQHVKGLRFNLQTYDGDQAENLGQKLLGSGLDLLEPILTALGKHPNPANVNVLVIKEVMTKLRKIADANELDEATVTRLSALVGEGGTGAGDTLLDPDHISFRPKVRQAIKTLFTQVSTEIPTLTPEEREAFAEVIAILSNFEELMGDLFSGYFTKDVTRQKKYFYLAWLLWAFIRQREDAGRANRGGSFYKTLSENSVSGDNIITFNYTDFFCDTTRPKNGYFHGDCRSYFSFATRDYITNVEVREATTLQRMVAFIDGLRTDWAQAPAEVSLPAIVPPLAMKPIICTEYLERWYKCGQTIKNAKTIVILGYSFSIADEHFNDLVRKGNSEAKVIVVNPDIEAVLDRTCQTLNQNKADLHSTNVEDLECKSGGRLRFVRAKAEEITSARLAALLRV